MTTGDVAAGGGTKPGPVTGFVPTARTAVPAPAGRSGKVRGSTGYPGWLRVADSCQRSLRRPLPVAVDVGIGAVVTGALTASARAALTSAVALLLGGMLFGVWKRRSSVQAQGVAWYLLRIIPSVTLASVAAWPWPQVGDRAAVAAGAATFAALAGLKSLLWLMVATARRRGLGLSRAMVIGPEEQVAAAEYRIHLYPEAGLVCAHSVVCAGRRTGNPDGSLALVERLLADHSIDHVVCTGGGSDSNSVMRDLVRLAPPTTEITVVTQVPFAGAPLTRVGDLSVICLARPSWGTDRCKRVVDVLGASGLLLVLAPLLVLTALAVRLGDPGPAIFRQLRTGRLNQRFTIYKFRSMVEDAESLKAQVMDRNVADGILFKAHDDPRITRVGATIRRFSIDELPQLVNVLRGDMSLVGPRPLPTAFAETDLFAQVRHRVLPGITGLWQVKGANALSYDAMIDLDCAYVATCSLGVDLKILLQTLPAVLVRRDPY